MRARRQHSARHAVSILGLIALIAGTMLAMVAPAAYATQPVPGHTGLVPDAVRTDTPRIETGAVVDIEVVGNRVYLAGSFTSIRNATGTAVVQPYLAAYNIDTGLLDMGFRPAIAGTVQAVEASPDGSALYIAGTFNTVNGVTKRKIARINPATGATVTGFTAQANSRATAIAVSDSWVYVGGFFSAVNGTSRGRLVALNPTTGAVDPGFNLPVTEGIGPGGVLKVMQLQLTSDDATLLVVHTGRNVAAQARTGVALIDTAAKSLRPWQTTLYADYLPLVGGVTRVFNGDISPDNSYFVVVSGSGGDRPPINDTAVAFPLAGGAGVQPLWVSRHFDSVYAVAITETAVYVGGHFRWQESPTATQPWPGLDTVSYGWGTGLGAAVLGDEVVRRDMIGALDPVTGTALPWNPGAEAFEGVKHLEAVPRGLLMGHDGSVIAGQAIGRHGFFDFERTPPPSPAETWIDNPFEGGTVGAEVPLAFEGRASAPSGVNRVQLEIVDRGNGQYLQDDGVTFASAWNAINATLDAPGAPETTWSFESPGIPDGQYRVYARTFATNGSRDSTKASAKFETVLLGDPTPETRIIQPLAGPVTTNTFLIQGTANDDSGVLGITLNAREVETNLYLQDDGTLRPEWNTFSTVPLNPGEPAVSWEYEITLPDGSFQVYATAQDDSGQSDLRPAARTWAVSATNVAPSITLTTPVTSTIVAPNTQVLIEGTATDDTSVRRVEVSVRNNNTQQGVQIDGTWGPVPAYYLITPPNTDALSVPFSYTTPPLPIGTYTIRVRAEDDLGTRTPTTAVPPSTVVQPNVTLTVGFAGDALPNTLLDFASTTQDYDSFTLPITGSATDNLGVSGVKLVVFNNATRRYMTSTAGGDSLVYTLIDTPVASPGATSTTFTSTFTLPGPGDYRITAIAVDSMGQYDASTTGATARYQIFPGDADPTLMLDLQTPVNGATLTNFIPIGGRATDDVGISRVNITVQNQTTLQFLRSDGTMGAAETNPLSAFLTNPGGVGSNFNYSTPTLAPGTYIVKVWPTDSVTQIMLVPYQAIVTVVAG